MQLFFNDDLHNLLLILGILFLVIFLNHLLNFIFVKYDKISNSRKLSGFQLCQTFARDNQLEPIEVVASTTLPEFDNVTISLKLVYLNGRSYQKDSLTSFFQTLLLLENFKYPPKKVVTILDPLVTLLSVIASTLIFFGLLLHLSTLVLIGIIALLGLSVISMLLLNNLLARLILLNEDARRLLKKEEMSTINKMAHFEIIKLALKPILALSKIFMFLLPATQKKSPKVITKNKYDSLTIGLNVLKKLNTSGKQNYLTGGAVRDFLLKRPVGDVDIASQALPDVNIKLIEQYDYLNKDGMYYGVLKYQIHGVGIDISTLRKEGTYLKNRRPSKVEFIEDLEVDAKRRDFTINALYLDEQGKIYDFFNGLTHLKEKKIVVIGDVKQRMEEDALRILRAIRLALKLGFSLDDELFNYIKENHQILNNLKTSTIKKEIEKMKKECPLKQVNELFEQLNISHYLKEDTHA